MGALRWRRVRYVLAHMSEIGPNPLLRQLFHMDRKTLGLFYEIMGKHYFGSSWDTPEMKEKMNRVSQIMAAKAICLQPRAVHINLLFLQGKKLRTAINLFIGDRLKIKM